MPKVRRNGVPGWMLRRSPYNEEFIYAVARTEEDLKYIAGQYIFETAFGEYDYIDIEVDLKAKTVTAHYGTHAPDDDNSLTFHISDVEIL